MRHPGHPTPSRRARGTAFQEKDNGGSAPSNRAFDATLSAPSPSLAWAFGEDHSLAPAAWIDSLADLRAATGDSTRFREFIHSLLHR